MQGLKWYIILQTRHLFLSTIRKYQGNAKFTKEISNLHCYLCNVHLTTYVLSEKCSGFKIGEKVLYQWYINIIRSPSCMAISWSYVCSDFWLLWEKGFIPPFFILFKKTQLWVLCIYFLGSQYISLYGYMIF